MNQFVKYAPITNKNTLTEINIRCYDVSMLGYMYKGHLCKMIKSLNPNKYSIQWAVHTFRGLSSLSLSQHYHNNSQGLESHRSL